MAKLSENEMARLMMDNIEVIIPGEFTLRKPIATTMWGFDKAAHAIAEKLADEVVWQDKFQLDEMGYLNILARTGPVLREPDERGIWFENNVKPNAWVELTVTVTKEE